MSLFEELKRRNVFRVGIAYVLMGWVLLQGADFLLDLVGAPDWVIRTLAVVVVIGLPIALFFAWAFELTPQGIKRESEVDRSESVTPQTGRKLDRAIIVFLVLIIVGMGIERFYTGGQQGPEPFSGQNGTVPAATPSAEKGSGTHLAAAGTAAPKSIAVLPFVDLSEAGNQAWFAAGLAEEILNALARTPDLLVASRTAAFAYKDTTTPLKQIARELGVEHVLEGSVRRVDDRIRVTAQLIRAEDGFHVWSENYDREARDVIALQEELALSIARALNTTMDPAALEDMLRVGTRSVAAYEAYLNGTSLLAEANSSGRFGLVLDSYDAFEEARRLDPQFSDAHARAAAFWRGQMSISRRGASQTDHTPEEKLALFEERIAAAIETADTALERLRHRILSASVHLRIREAVRLALEALALNPYDQFVLQELEESILWSRDEAAAQLVLDRAHELREQGAEWAGLYVRSAWRAPEPRPLADFIDWALNRYEDRDLLYQSHRALLWEGEVEKAAALVPRLRGERSQSFALVAARQACAEGRRSEAERLLASLDPTLSAGDRASTEWHLLQMLGRHDEAHEGLRPWASREVPLPVGAYLIYPDFDPSYFPFVQDILRRENIDRPAPRAIPFACPDQDEVNRESVAVLPFRAMSSGPDDEFFADGLTEEILNALSQVPGLAVTSRTSSFYFKDKDLPIADIAQQLGVNHVVEGSVRRSGERLRVTAQLIRSDDDTHLWSETYDSTDADAIAVQEDIARQISETLNVFLDESTLANMRSAGLRDVTAFIEYQKGRQLHEEAHGSDDMLDLLAEGNAHLKTALDIQPGFSPAWLYYSDYYTHVLLDSATGELEPPASEEQLREAVREARIAFQQAARNTVDPEARAAAELDLAIFNGDSRAWRPLMNEVVDSGFCATIIWHQLVGYLPDFNDDFTDYVRRLIACDPLTNRHRSMIQLNQVWAGQSARALEENQGHAGEETEFEIVGRLRALVALGRFDEAVSVAAIDTANETNRAHERTLIAAARGDRAEAERIQQSVTAASRPNDWLRLTQAAVLGDRDTANRLAAKIDGKPLGHLALMITIYWCACGSPFDLEAAPNFAATWQAAEFPWPLESPIDFPLKDW